MELLSISSSLSSTPLLQPTNASLPSLKPHLTSPPKLSLLKPTRQTPITSLHHQYSLTSRISASNAQSTLSPVFDDFEEFGESGLGKIGGTAPPQTSATAMREAEADVMGLLLKERIVFLGCELNDVVGDGIISQLLMLDAQDSTKDIRLFIHSSGGSLSAALAIFDTMQVLSSDISTIAIGNAASTASLILGGGTKGKRFAMPNARIMFQQPIGGSNGQALHVEIQAEEIMKSKNNVIRIISEFSGRSFEQVEKDIDKDHYMSPMEALEYGFIDEVIDKDRIIALAPVPRNVRSRYNFEEINEDLKKFTIPEIPDDEIY